MNKIKWGVNVMPSKKYDLRDRLIDFTIHCILISEKLPNSFSGRFYANQLIRSSGSAALNYGEAQDAESKNDFIHKIKVVLKELRETNMNLMIISRKPLIRSEILKQTIQESDELISIFVTSLKTARKKI